jgi:hypothetical protein
MNKQSTKKQSLINAMKEELFSQRDGPNRGRHPQDLGWIDFDGDLAQLDGWVDLSKMADRILNTIEES